MNKISTSVANESKCWRSYSETNVVYFSIYYMLNKSFNKTLVISEPKLYWSFKNDVFDFVSFV